MILLRTLYVVGYSLTMLPLSLLVGLLTHRAADVWYNYHNSFWTWEYLPSDKGKLTHYFKSPKDFIFNKKTYQITL